MYKKSFGALCSSAIQLGTGYEEQLFGSFMPFANMYIHNHRLERSEFSPTPLTVVDVTEAEKKIVKATQAQSFPVETDETV